MASIEIGLAVVFYLCAILYVRPAKKAAKAAKAAQSGQAAQSLHVTQSSQTIGGENGR
jgi:hypothetical protein